MTCVWLKLADGSGVHCERCKTRRVQPRNRVCRSEDGKIQRAPRKPRRDPLKCAHLVGPTDRDVRVKNCGCAGDRATGILATVFECEIHRECVIVKGDPVESHVVSCLKNCSDFVDLGVYTADK